MEFDVGLTENPQGLEYTRSARDVPKKTPDVAAAKTRPPAVAIMATFSRRLHSKLSIGDCIRNFQSAIAFETQCQNVATTLSRRMD